MISSIFVKGFHDFAFSGNPIVITIKSDAYSARQEKEDFKFRFEIFLKEAAGADFTNIYSEYISQNTPFSGSASVDVSKIIDAYLADVSPFFESVRAQRRTEYYCRFAEKSTRQGSEQLNYNRTLTYAIIKGGLSHIGFKTKKLIDILQPNPSNPSENRFLKQGPRNITIRDEQPEWLTFINVLPGAASLFEIQVSVNYVNGQSNTGRISLSPMDQYDKVEIYCGTEILKLIPTNDQNLIKNYSIWIAKKDDQAIVSEKVTYHIDAIKREHVRYFVYISSFGVLATLVTYGEGSEEYELTSQSINRPKYFDYELADSSRINYNMQLQRAFTTTTGWLEKRDFDLLADFFLSEKKWIMKDGIPIPITVTNKKGGEYHDGKGLIAQLFEYRYDFNDTKYTEGDTF